MAHYPQQHVELRPRAERSFAGRIHTVAMSPDSYTGAGEMGATMMAFVTDDVTVQKVGIEVWRDTYRATVGEEPQHPILTDHTFCHEDPQVAEEMAMQYGPAYYASVISHYGYGGDGFEGTRSYGSYADLTRATRARGFEQLARDFVNVQIWGRPEQIIEKYRRRYSLLGDVSENMVFSYGVHAVRSCR